MKYYILVDRKPVVTDDQQLWAKGMEIDRRRVAWTKLDGDVEVSTVFLGIDHAWGDSPPRLFETMVFRTDGGDECWRYSTWADSAAGHERVVAALRSGAPLDELDLPAGGAA